MPMRIAVFVSFISAAMVVYAQDVIVSQGGEGDFRTIGEALKQAPEQATKPYIIRIRKGVYREKIFIDKPFIKLEGENRETTQIVYPVLWRVWEREFKPSKDNTDIRWGCATVNLSPRANDCTLNGLTLYNNYGSTIENTVDHQFAVFGRSTRVIITQCNVYSDGSDTLSLWNKEAGMYYHADCHFRSRGVDYVCPRGWCYITRCRFEGAAYAHLWHDGSGDPKQKFVIHDSTFESSVPSVLGRYHKEHCFYLVNCVLKQKIKDVPIQYAYSDKKPLLRWGERIYFLKCRNLEGPPFAWTRDNSPLPVQQFTAKWTFDGRWDPEPAP
jgi:hypothetical protein